MSSESPGDMSWMLRVPASSANLGPGFDAIGLALGIYLKCRFQPASNLQIHVAGRDAPLIPTTEENLIWQAAQAVAREVGLKLPPLHIEIYNDIPIGKGLGSSAAALTAGVVLANVVLGLRWRRNRILDVAARIEGHPDNVAACVFGSVVVSAVDASGRTRAIRLELPPDYRVAVVVPDFVLPTVEARSVLPTHYRREQIVFNLQRATLLVAALATGDSTAFPTAFEDQIHQPYRAGLVPGLEEILKLRAPGLLGCALSGAGPSVVVLYRRGSEEVCDLVRDVFRRHGQTAEIIWSNVAPSGYELLREECVYERRDRQDDESGGLT